MTDDRPLHSRVRETLLRLALATPVGERTTIPPEPELMRMTEASRGTVRRAVEDLVATGLLVKQPGRGTFVDPNVQARMLISDDLAKVAKPDSRFDRNFSQFVPDFEGSDECAQRITALELYQRSAVIFATRDNNLLPLREHALRHGKRLIVPSHGLRSGLRALRDIPAGLERFAATLDGLDEFAELVPLAEVGSYGQIGVVVTGAVAATPKGLLFGAVHDYFRAELALLAGTGTLTDDCVVAAAVHDCQVVHAAAATPDGAIADLVVTPTTIHWNAGTSRSWIARELPEFRSPDVPELAELLRRLPGG